MLSGRKLKFYEKWEPSNSYANIYTTKYKVKWSANDAANMITAQIQIKSLNAPKWFLRTIFGVTFCICTIYKHLQ